MRVLTLNNLFTALLILTLTSCAFKSRSGLISKLDKYHIVEGCSIYDIDHNIIASYPGNECLFHDDGSFLSYDPNTFKLSKYDNKLSLLWELKLHVHHSIKLTSEGNYLINTSTIHPFAGIKKVRFDQILLISPQGKILNNFSFYKERRLLQSHGYQDPMETSWEPNLDFTHEMTHVASSYEILESIEQDGQVIIPKGSIIVATNAGAGPGAYVLSKDLHKAIKIYNLNEQLFHDVQQFSKSELIYFVNDGFVRETGGVTRAHVSYYDVLRREKIREIRAGFSSIYSGSVQVMDDDLLFITDANSKFGQI